MENIPAVFGRVELFHGLDADQLEQIALISKHNVHRLGEVIFEQDSVGDALYIIAHGQVEVRARGNDDVQRALIYLGPGQTFGEMALIDQGTRSASIMVAEDNTTIFRIPIEQFTQLCSEQTDIGYLLMRNIAQDLSFKLRHQDYNPKGT